MTRALSAHDQRVRDLDRLKKADLIRVALAVGDARGDHWIVGGPADWSKDELVSYLVREYR